MPKNREKSFSRSLHAPISDIWRQQLRPLPTPTEPNRHSAYIVIAGSDIDRTDLFKPAPYLLSDTQISPKCLFRVRTQHAKEIPTHNHLHSTSYSDRSCPFCHSTLIVGNESHYLFGCPSITPIMEPMYVPFQETPQAVGAPIVGAAASNNKNLSPTRELPPPPNTETQIHSRPMAPKHWELLRLGGAQTLFESLLPANNCTCNLEWHTSPEQPIPDNHL
jgi:hypothetical protein